VRCVLRVKYPCPRRRPGTHPTPTITLFVEVGSRTEDAAFRIVALREAPEPFPCLPGITRLTLEPRLPDPETSSSLLSLSSNCHLTPYPRILLCPGLPISLEVALRKKLRECLAGPTNLDQTSPAMVGEPRVMDLVPRIPRVLAKLQHPMPLWPSYLLLQPRP
jgi:hypothetical protein